MKITYDSEVDALDIHFQKGKYEISQELIEGVIVDYTKSGKIISIEILNASKKLPLSEMKKAIVNISAEG
ncbi:MAG: DUF2283 domain-containing protein [Candidatus Micrarchaeaceae archaeon]|jgi:uncharacterized protein YuzE